MNKRIPLFAIFLLAVPALVAQTNPPPAFHLFGGWAYGRTDGNEYLAGTRAGAYDNADLALNAAASPMERLRLEAQAFMEIEHGDRKTQIDYAFAEWRFSDALKLHVGRMAHPFGIYTEIFDVGTLRPFYSLPQSVYGPAGNAAEAYSGAGVTGFRKLAAGWSMTYDLYAGQLDVPFSDFDHDAPAAGTGSPLRVTHVLGGRAVVETPLEGFSFGASAYRGNVRSGEVRDPHAAVGGQLEYAAERLSLRGEITRNQVRRRAEHAGYFEAAWHVTPHWQVAGRFDALAEHGDRTVDGRHTEQAVALNYWFTRQFVAKLSMHRVQGTHFAAPDATSGSLEPRTHLVMLGTQFSF